MKTRFGTPLDYEDYKDFEIDPAIDGQWLFRFNNGYGASVIKHPGSYGYFEDLFELAVLKFRNKTDWSLCCDTEITNDVIGYLTNKEVLDLLERIKNL